MDAQFWINVWNEGKTNFHQRDFNEKLTQYFPKLNPTQGQEVLVPLCGKSKDLLWLHQLNLQVHGVELHEDAVAAFFIENELSPLIKTQDHDFTVYTYKNIRISCGDFFRLDPAETYDFVYDRAALVALPHEMRKDYAEVIKRSLRKGGRCLLIVYEYDPSKMDGPPFSVDAKEVNELYQDRFDIQLLENETPSNEGARLSAVESLKQKVYLLEKIRD